MIRDAVRKTGTVGFGRIVLSTREHAALVQAHGGGLTLTTLRSSDEVRSEPAIFANRAGEQSSAELVAEQLIKQRLGDFDPAACRDRYQDMLQELIEGKLKALPAAERVAPEPRATVVNLMHVLRKLVEAAGEKPPASGKGRKPAIEPAQKSAGRRKRA